MIEGVGLRKLQAAVELTPLLAWTRCVVDREVQANSYDALLGTKGDGVRFNLEFFGTRHRRGRWRLLIEVLPGEHHHAWGRFDAADQPVRCYHDLGCAVAEAEAIAAVLLRDRNKREG